MAKRIPKPTNNERPTSYAERVGRWYDSFVTAQHKKTHGQYLTPVEVADFMANLLPSKSGSVRILDPGAGTGILSCAACEHLVGRKIKPSEVLLEAYETEPQLCRVLEKTLMYLKDFVSKHGVTLTFAVKQEDFILEHAHLLCDFPALFPSPEKEIAFDIVISNPPYFKIPKSDPRARAAASIVHGQPNVYSLFMAISSSLLSNGGYLVFITPRSFASGPYFRSFREHFFTDMKPVFIHLFDSRSEAFKRYRVLQENIILKAQKVRGWAAKSQKDVVLISSSNGGTDLSTSKVRKLPLPLVIDMKSYEKMLRIPVSPREEEVIRLVESWSGSLKDYGLEISTGPVVPFRATQHLLEDPDSFFPHAPLLWMQNVQPMRIEWPLSRFRKPQYIKVTAESMSILVANKTYVIIRRFSAKEDRRRLVAAPLVEGQLGQQVVGLENHLNYIHRPNGTLSADEAWGLAVLYNSDIFDTYFRSLNGNTQVSATEIRTIPLPPMHVIEEIGRKARSLLPHGSSELEPLNTLASQSIARVVGRV